MKLLVVDDDEDVLDVLIEVLENAGFNVALATNGDDALMEASRGTPDVLVTDINLGAGMDGIQLAAEARRRWPSLPVVYISGRPWLMNDHVLDEREAFLPKPFRQRELIRGVHAVTAKRDGPSLPRPASTQ